MDYVMALDVGGTGMKAALLDRDGAELYRAHRRTGRERGPAAVVDAVLDFARELAALGGRDLGRPPAAAGVAVPGHVDERTGVAVYSANLGWRDVPVRRLLQDALPGVPVALGHDVRCGGLAEGRIGAARTAEHFLFVALGTGIAGAVGLGGRVHAGAHGLAGELGHIVVRPGGVRCACGVRGCLETVSSASAIARAWTEHTGRPTSAARDVGEAMAAGDATAAGLWQEAVDALADGLTTALGVLDPDTVVIGGGLAQAGERLLAPLRTALGERAAFRSLPRVLAAELGERAGCIGAGLLARGLLDDARNARSAAGRSTRPRTAARTETDQ